MAQNAQRLVRRRRDLLPRGARCETGLKPLRTFGFSPSEAFGMRGFWRPLSKAIALDGTVTRSHPLRFGTRWSSTTREFLHDSNGSLASRVGNKMDAHRPDIDRAREQIHETTQKADSYLTELTKRVDEYEQKHSDMEPATQYLKSALDASRSATQKLKTQGQDLSERTVPVALDGMQGVRESLDELQKQAVAYDDKYAGSTGQHAMETLHHYVNSGRQAATDALETTTGQLTKLRDTIGNMAGQATHGAQVAVGEAVRVAEFGDEKLGVTSMGSGVVQKVRDLDARLGVTAVAARVDNTVTGGLGSKVASTTVGIVSESVNYITETLHNAKLAAEQSDTAQGVEAKGAEVTEAATKKKDEMKATFNESVEHGKAKAGMATSKAEEKAGQARDMAQDKAGQAKEKAGEMKDMAAEKAGQAKDMAQDKAGHAKDKAGEMKDMAAEKAGQAKDMAQDKAGQAKDKAGEMKDMAAEKAGQAKDMAQDKAGQAKDKAGDMKDMTAEKAGQAKDMAKDKAGQAKDMAQDKAGQAKDKAGQAKDMAQEKAGQAKETTKDKAGQAKDMAQDKAGQAKETAKDKAASAQHKMSESADQAKDKAGAAKEQTKAKGGDAKEQSEGIAGKVVDMAKNAKDQVKERIGSAVDTVTNLGTVAEAKVMKPKEPTTTQEETMTEKGLEGLKQSRAKESEAAKTASGTARKELEGKQNSAMKNK
uniref:Uncharacterized protein n=1 Tax=Peronospora matthiolae TaxID=2874970 RepID=A0AAV1UA70_9STRA